VSDDRAIEDKEADTVKVSVERNADKNHKKT